MLQEILCFVGFKTILAYSVIQKSKWYTMNEYVNVNQLNKQLD